MPDYSVVPSLRKATTASTVVGTDTSLITQGNERIDQGRATGR